MIKLIHLGIALLALLVVEVATAHEGGHDNKPAATDAQNATGGFGAAHVRPRQSAG